MTRWQPHSFPKTFFSYRRCRFILWTAPRRGIVSPVTGYQPLVWNNFNPLGTFALFCSTETTTQMSTNLASWLRRNCCQSEWVTAGFTYYHSWVKMFTYSSFYLALFLHYDMSACTVFPACIHGCLHFRWLTCTRWLQKCGRRGSQRVTQSTGAGRGKNCCTQLYHCEAPQSLANFSCKFT